MQGGCMGDGRVTHAWVDHPMAQVHVGYSAHTAHPCTCMHAHAHTWTFCAPATPVRLEIPARFTREAICLQARAVEAMTVASSPSMVPFCSSCNDHGGGGREGDLSQIHEMGHHRM